jgi:hypothetical protein
MNVPEGERGEMLIPSLEVGAGAVVLDPEAIVASSV